MTATKARAGADDKPEVLQLEVNDKMADVAENSGCSDASLGDEGVDDSSSQANEEAIKPTKIIEEESILSDKARVTAKEEVTDAKENLVISHQQDDCDVYLQAGDSYLTDKVAIGNAGTGVYMSVKGTSSEPYLFMEPINGTSGIVTAEFTDGDEYVASDYYLKVISLYKDKITSIKIADGTSIKLEDNCNCLFAGLPALTDISALSRLETLGMTQMAEMCL